MGSFLEPGLTHTHTYTYTHARAHTHTCIDTYTHAHACMHMHVHTRMHTLLQLCKQINVSGLLLYYVRPKLFSFFSFYPWMWLAIFHSSVEIGIHYMIHLILDYLNIGFKHSVFAHLLWNIQTQGHSYCLFSQLSLYLPPLLIILAFLYCWGLWCSQNIPLSSCMGGVSLDLSFPVATILSPALGRLLVLSLKLLSLYDQQENSSRRKHSVFRNLFGPLDLRGLSRAALGHSISLWHHHHDNQPSECLMCALGLSYNL